MFLVAHIKMKDIFLAIETIHIKHLPKFLKYFAYLYDADKFECKLVTKDELGSLTAYRLADSVVTFDEHD